MKDNAEHLTPVKKADFELSHLTGNSGYLLPAQAKKFFRLLTKKAKVMGLFDVAGMSSYKEKVHKIKFDEWVLQPGTSGEALAEGQRVRPNLTEVELDAQMFKFEAHISEEVFDDNIEGPALRQTIMQLLSERVAANMENIVLNGDTTSTTPVLAKLNGIVKQATSHTVDAGAASITPEWLQKVRKALPIQHREDAGNMRYMTSPNVVENYGEELESRQTPLGDKQITDAGVPKHKSTELLGVPVWNESYGGVGNRAAVLYLNPKNVKVGIWKQVKIRVKEDYQADTVIIVGKTRFDVKYKDEDAVVKLENVAIV